MAKKEEVPVEITSVDGRSSDAKGSDWAHDDETAKGSTAKGSDWKTEKEDVNEKK